MSFFTTSDAATPILSTSWSMVVNRPGATGSMIDFDRPGYDGFSYANFEGHGQLVKLNHANGQVLDWAVDVARYWMDRGVDAFRLDAAYAIPAGFLAAFADRVRAVRSGSAADRRSDPWRLHGDGPQRHG